MRRDVLDTMAELEALVEGCVRFRPAKKRHGKRVVGWLKKKPKNRLGTSSKTCRGNNWSV